MSAATFDDQFEMLHPGHYRPFRNADLTALKRRPDVQPQAAVDPGIFQQTFFDHGQGTDVFFVRFKNKLDVAGQLML